MGCLLSLFRKPVVHDSPPIGSEENSEHNNSVDSSEVLTPSGELESRDSRYSSVDLSKDNDSTFFITMPMYNNILKFLQAILSTRVNRDNLE